MRISMTSRAGFWRPMMLWIDFSLMHLIKASLWKVWFTFTCFRLKKIMLDFTLEMMLDWCNSCPIKGWGLALELFYDYINPTKVQNCCCCCFFSKWGHFIDFYCFYIHLVANLTLTYNLIIHKICLFTF